MKQEIQERIEDLESKVGKETCVDYLAHLVCRSSGDWSDETTTKLRDFAIAVRNIGGSFSKLEPFLRAYVVENGRHIPEGLREQFPDLPKSVSFDPSFLKSLSDNREKMFAGLDDKTLGQIGTIVADAFCGKKERKFVVASQEEAQKIKEALLDSQLSVEIKHRSDGKETVICQW